MLEFMTDKVEISLEEFKEYMNLKSQNNLINEQLKDLVLMSDMQLEELCQLNLIEFRKEGDIPAQERFIFSFQKSKKKYSTN